MGQLQPWDSLDVVLFLKATDHLIECLLRLLLLVKELVVSLTLLFLVCNLLLSLATLDALDLSVEEAEGSTDLFNEGLDLLQDTSIMLQVILEHVDLSLPFEHFLLNVVKLDAKSRGRWVVVTHR